MRNSFLDYYKMILDKVSFDNNLFAKEHRKAIRMLAANEADLLNRWLEARGLLVSSRREKPVAFNKHEPSL